MINDDVLRKWSERMISEGNINGFKKYTYDRDLRIHKLKHDILRIKLGFKGIGNDHMSLIDVCNVKRGDRIIWDYYLDNNSWDDSMDFAPKIFQIISMKSQGDEHNRGILLGIGNGRDTDGDPGRMLVIGKTYIIDNLINFRAIIRLDSMGRYKKFDNRTV